MEKIKFVTLLNQSMDEREQNKVLSIGLADLDGSKMMGGSKELKDLIRQGIDDLFAGDLLDYLEEMEVSVEDYDHCIDELSIGNASNVAGESFWWSDAEELIVGLGEAGPVDDPLAGYSEDFRKVQPSSE